MNSAELIDSLVANRVLVFGSLPPTGRDLDLLVRPQEAQAISHGLAEDGFQHRDGIWARLGGCSADVVELVRAADWHLPGPELQALFDEAVPLEGHRHVAKPAPHHVLLILARKVASGAELSEKRRQRAQTALDDHPGSLELARRRAPAWDATRALEALERALRTGSGPDRPRLRRFVRRPRRGVLVSFSGLDGSGKSSQATALQETLDRLGYPAVIEWTSLARHSPVLHAITGAIGWVARLRGGSPSPEVEEGTTAPDPRKELRQRSRLVNTVWHTLVALSNALTHLRTVGRHLWRGRTVICDRYVLDSEVHLRFAYGEKESFGFQSALIRFLSPKPDRAYLLDVSGEEATRRKQDYNVEDNTRRARLYRAHHARLGVQRIDGTRPKEEICAEIVEDVWRLLSA